MKKFCFAVAAAVAIFTSHARAGEDDKHLDIYWVDVEGGGGTLIVGPTGDSLLIDSGNPGGRDAQRIHRVASEVAGLSKIDVLVTTHFHIDHFGGAYELSQLIPIGTIIDKGVPNSLVEDRSFPIRIKPYLEIDAERVVVRAGERFELPSPDGAAPFTAICVAADRAVIGEVGGAKPALNPHLSAITPAAYDKSDNAASVNLVFQFGDFRFYDGGDTTRNVEQQLIAPFNNVGEVDVYQVNHHGLDTSNSEAFLRSLSPTVSVMNNGATKGCMPLTFAGLSAAPSIQAMYQLHKNVRDDGDVNNTQDAFIANHHKECDANYIHLSVVPDGSSYTVSIPATGHKATYKTKKI
jgi:beta-lactamase superfamily II metal-dependent hydrolase